MNDVMVSIICNTYNQADYLADALDSFLSQETSFAIEILVHDDASTDGTTQILEDYAARHPDVIKPLYEEKNQYTLGEPHNFAVQSARVKGKYIALCEGDDYWTDPHKLQLQFDAMERHPELDICTHTGASVRADSKLRVGLARPRSEDCIIPVRDVIMGGGDFVVTSSVFMRAEAFVHPPKIVTEFNLDYLVQVSGSMRGGMYYLDRCMSAHRVSSKGSFSRKMTSSAVRTAEHIQRVIDALQILDMQTGHLYTKDLQDHVDELNFRYAGYVGHFSDAFRTEAWRTKSLFSKMKYLPGMLLHAFTYRLDSKRA